MADLRPRSYIVAPSPSAQYADLDASLEAQVVDSRKNLLEAFHDTPAFTLTLDDEQPLNLNEVGDEFLKVFLRIRPFTNEELANQEDKECIKVSNSTTICTTAPPESCAYRNAQHLGADRIHTDFVFTRVFGPDVQQREIFESITFDLMKQFVAGESSLLFSYGVTNSGKTHTIQGTDADPGLIPQTLNCLFAFAKDRLFGEVCFKPKLYNETVVCDDVDKRALMKQKESLLRLAEINEPDVFLLESTCNLTKALSSSESSLASSSSSVTDLNEICNTIDAVQLGRGFSGFKYSIWVSFVEIYNEYVYDLLDPVTNVKGKRRCALKLSEDKKGNIYIKNLIEINVNSCEEALKLLTFGQKNLRYASTKLNYNSSRSHCVFNLRLMRLAYKNGKIVVEKTSKFSFCDLAGSERTSKTGSTGDRVKEAGNINTSLLNLGRCINTLRHNQTHRDKAQIIPFRDSKLTRLFQNFLVGRGKACMIVNISQCASCFDETLQVLQFSALVKQVKQVKSRDDVAAEFERASQVPLIDEEDEDQEFSVLDTTLAAENNWAQTVQKYQSIIDYLRAQLLEERTKSLRIQEQVREELCEQFAAQMQEMNDNYLKIRREGMQEAEDAADERLELYIQTVKKRQNKERRVTLTANAGDEEEGWVPESLLAAERMKNEKNELLIKELQQKLSEVEKPAGDGLQTKVDADKTESFSDWLVSDSEGQSSSHKQELQIQLEKKIKECQDLEDMLNEAGETYKANEKEIDQLKSLVASLEADKESIASSKDERIAQLENLLQEPKVKTADNEKDKQVASEGSPNFGVEISAKVVEESAQQSSATEMEESSEMDGGFKLIELESKIFDLEKSIESLTVENKNLKQKVNSANESEQKFQTKIADLEKQLSQKTQIALSSGQLRSQLQKSELKLEELEKQLKEAACKENKLKHDKRKAEDEVKQKVAQIQKLESSLEEMRRKTADLTKSVEENATKLSQFESIKTEMENYIRELMESKKELAEKLAQLEQEFSQNKNVYDETLADKTREIFELKSALEQYIVTDRELRDSYNSYRSKSDQSEKEIGELKDQLDLASVNQQKSEDSLKSLQTSFETLKRSLENMTHSLADKNRQISELELVNKNNEQTIEELNNEILAKDQNHVKICDDLRADLDTTKDSLVDLKREKLHLTEKIDALEEEIKNRQAQLQTLENDLEIEKANNMRIMQDSRENEKLIEWYKNAISNQEELQQKLQEAVSNRNDEISALNTEVQNFKSQLETMENDLLLQQKEKSQLVNDLETKKEAMENIKSVIEKTEAELKSMKEDLALAQEKCAQQESLLSKKAHEESENSQRMLEQQKKNVDFYENTIKALSKEISDKNFLIDNLTRRISKKENDLVEIENEILRLESLHKEAIIEKERQMEELNYQADILRRSFNETQHEREMEIKKLNELLSEKDLTISKLSESISLSPPTGKRVSVSQKRSSNTEDESVTEVELTPMVSTKTSSSNRNSRKAETSIGSLESFGDYSFLPKPVRTPARRVKKAVNVRIVEDDSKSEEAGASTAPKTKKPPRPTKPKRVKTVAVLTEENSPVYLHENVGLIGGEILNQGTTRDDEPATGGRLARKAKSTARNGIFAVTEYLRNSPGAASASGSTATSTAVASASVTSSSSSIQNNPDPVEAVINEISDQNLPLKKRKRTLYRSPTSPVILAPEQELDVAKPPGKPSTAKKTRKKV